MCLLPRKGRQQRRLGQGAEPEGAGPWGFGHSLSSQDSEGITVTTDWLTLRSFWLQVPSYDKGAITNPED